MRLPISSTWGAVVLVCLLFAVPGRVVAQAENFKFGILQAMPDGHHEMATETVRIPKLLKDTGFRFGITFENPRGAAIEWYEVVRLPGEMPQVTGTLQRSGPRTIRGETQRSAEKQLLDYFWFDEGDPLGRHRLELYVNGKRVFSTDFDVVRP